MNLYELTQNYLQLLNAMEERDLAPQLIADTLDSIKEPMKQKSENIVKMIQKFDNDVKIIDEEIKRLQALRSSTQHKADSLKHYLRDMLYMLPEPKVKTSLFSIWVQNNPQALDIESEEYIPKKYFVEQKPKLDKRKLLNDLKNGEEIQGVGIKQTRGVRFR